MFKARWFGVNWAANLRQRLEAGSMNAVLKVVEWEIDSLWSTFRGCAAVRNIVLNHHQQMLKKKKKCHKPNYFPLQVVFASLSSLSLIQAMTSNTFLSQITVT